MRNRRALFSSFLLTTLFLAACLTGTAQQPAERPPQNINEHWRSENIEPLIETLEAESRDIYRERELLAAVVGPPPGAVVADVGAGSGFMTLLFAQMVGPQGKVFAVDINPRLLEHIASRARTQGLNNVRTIVAVDDNSNLPPNVVDIVFICDTYHHFEFPRETMASIHRALKPGGQLVLVEFHREAGNSADWVMQHVRAGQREFTREIESAGFELINQHNVPAIPDNYILRFRKAEKSTAVYPQPGITELRLPAF